LKPAEAGAGTDCKACAEHATIAQQHSKASVEEKRIISVALTGVNVAGDENVRSSRCSTSLGFEGQAASDTQVAGDRFDEAAPLRIRFEIGKGRPHTFRRCVDRNLRRYYMSQRRGTIKKTLILALVAAFCLAIAPSDGAAPPVYPGATLSKKPEFVAASSSPHAKAYVSPDSLAKVIAWYKSALPNADEMSDPNDKTTDVFMIHGGKSGMVVVVQAYGGKTWIVIGPGFPQ
jgi:hypothetical protein